MSEYKKALLGLGGGMFSAECHSSWKKKSICTLHKQGHRGKSSVRRGCICNGSWMECYKLTKNWFHIQMFCCYKLSKPVSAGEEFPMLPVCAVPLNNMVYSFSCNWVSSHCITDETFQEPHQKRCPYRRSASLHGGMRWDEIGSRLAVILQHSEETDAGIKSALHTFERLSRGGLHFFI